MDNSNEPTNWIPTSFSSAPEAVEGDSLSSCQSANTPGSAAVDQQSDDQSFDALSRQKLNLTTTNIATHDRSSPRIPGMSMFEEDTRSSWSVEPKPTQLKEASCDNSADSPTKIPVSDEPISNEPLQVSNLDDVFEHNIEDNKRCMEESQSALSEAPSSSVKKSIENSPGANEKKTENESDLKVSEATSVWQVNASFTQNQEETVHKEDSEYNRDNAECADEGFAPTLTSNTEKSLWGMEKNDEVLFTIDSGVAEVKESSSENCPILKDELDNKDSATHASKITASDSINCISGNAAVEETFTDNVMKDNIVHEETTHSKSKSDIIKEVGFDDFSNNSVIKKIFADDDSVSNDVKNTNMAENMLQKANVSENSMTKNEPTTGEVIKKSLSDENSSHTSLTKETNIDEESQMGFCKGSNVDEDSVMAFLKGTIEDSEMSILKETNEDSEMSILKETSMDVNESQVSFIKETDLVESQISNLKEEAMDEEPKISKEGDPVVAGDSLISKVIDPLIDEDSQISKTNDPIIDEDSQISKTNDPIIDEDSQISKTIDPIIDEDSQISKTNDPIIDEDSQLSESREIPMEEDSLIVAEELTENLQGSANKEMSIDDDSQISVHSPMISENVNVFSKGVNSQSNLDPKQVITALDEESQSSVLSQKSQSSQKSCKRLRLMEENINGVFLPENLLEYMWPQENGEFFILQEQICDYLNIKSFKRKYPDLARRAVDMDEKQFLKEKGVVTEMQCDLGLTALRSDEVLELMSKDYPDHYRDYIKVLRDKETQSITEKHKEFVASNSDKTKMVDLVKKAVQSAAEYNAHLNQERREERRSCMDLQTFTIHYPAKKTAKPKSTTKPGKYPVALLPGQYQDYYKQFTPNELKYLPLNTVLYGPLKELQSTKALSDGSQSDSDDSSASEGSCSSSQGTHDESSSGSEKNDNGKASASEKNGTSAENAYHPKVKPNAICKVCKKGPEGKDGKSEELVHCAECDNSAHPSCIELTSDVVDVLKTYPWQCMDCKVCSHCSDPNDEDKMLFCDLCDRGYHTFCVGLKSLPQGKWVCRRCGSCSVCGATKPGPETSKAQWLYDSSKGVVELDANRRPKIMCQSCFKKKR